MSERLTALLARMRADHEAYEREHEEWVRSPLPRYFHSCRRHVSRMGTVNGTFIQRCTCGGINVGGMWLEKNSSRAFHRAERKRLMAERYGPGIERAGGAG